MEPINLTTKEAILYLAIFGAVVGLVLGLIALLLAAKRGKKGLGFGAVIACVIGGAFSPVIAVIVFIVFLVLILRKPKEVIVVNEEPVDVSVSGPKDS
jgi:hypothetical protein